MIKTFRKEQGGYALAYVMIVILVVMSVVMIVCTTAMKNYEAQQDSVKRMADKYAAEGVVEKVFLQIQQATVTKKTEREFTIAPESDNLTALKASAVDAAVSAYLQEILGLDPDPYEGADPVTDPDETPTKITATAPVAGSSGYQSAITITHQKGTASVRMQFMLTFAVSVGDVIEPGIGETNYGYSAEAKTVSTELTVYEIGGAA